MVITGKKSNHVGDPGGGEWCETENSNSGGHSNSEWPGSESGRGKKVS